MKRRNKSNLIPVMERERPPTLPEMTPAERREFLHALNLWRVFDMYFDGLREMAVA